MKQAVNILVVDDDPNLRKTLSGILRIKGYQTIVASSGADAIAAMEQNTGTRYDPEIVDICVRLFTEQVFSFKELPGSAPNNAACHSAINSGTAGMPQ